MLPSLYRIGEKWQANKVSVAQEHIASAIVQLAMTAGLLRSQPPPMVGKRVLLACVAANNHAIGLRMVSDAFQLAGWEVQYLGADVPTSALVGQVVEWKPDLSVYRFRSLTNCGLSRKSSRNLTNVWAA